MKFSKTLFSTAMILASVIFLFSCKPTTPQPDPVDDELEGFKLAKVMNNSNHNIELYTRSGDFQVGYNEVYFQVKKLDGTLEKEITATWQPLMNMTAMKHSCPSSTVVNKTNANTTFGGYIIFQMSSNTDEYWELKIDYKVDGVSFSVVDKIDVKNVVHKNLQIFTGSDSTKYLLALSAPLQAKVGINEIGALLYQVNSDMDYSLVNNYTIKIDPRMPSMGNHSSPNNEDLKQGTDFKYYGKLNLTMTGYWKINLMLENATGTILKGEAITPTNESSSIFFEIEI